jgi:2,3-diketo-5-methylthio-1-phosphopentane phosphatase
METVLKYYKNHGITSEHVLRRLKKIQLAPGMKELMLDIYNSEQEAIILSDSNQAFIDFILKSHNLGGVFHPCNVYTNYSCLDQTNDLFKMRARDSQKDCDICPPNFCKGKMLMRHMKFRKERGLKTIRIIYVGSERTGMCPCLRLGSQVRLKADKKQPRGCFKL